MGMFLFDEQPIFANKTLAKEIGLNEALVLQQINYWLEINKKQGKNFFDGRYWTYNSIRSWHENDFDYLSIDTVKRTFAKLEKSGFLVVGNYNKDPRDKTKWYSINETKLEELYLEVTQRKKREAFEALQKAMPNALVQNAPMEKCKMPQCKDADCTNALEQNALMHFGSMPQPLPDISTDNSTEINTTYNSSYTSTIPSIIGAVTNDNTGTGGREEGKDPYEYYLNELRTNAAYFEHMSLGNKLLAQQMDEILRVLAEVYLLGDEEYIQINRNRMKAKIVKDRFLKLDQFHIEYLLDLLKNNKYEIKNARAFLLTAAFNALSAMDTHYTASVYNDNKWCGGGYYD